MSDAGLRYEIVREVFEHHDDFPAPDQGKILHTHRIDGGLEVWFRRPIPADREKSDEERARSFVDDLR